MGPANPIKIMIISFAYEGIEEKEQKINEPKTLLDAQERVVQETGGE